MSSEQNQTTVDIPQRLRVLRNGWPDARDVIDRADQAAVEIESSRVTVVSMACSGFRAASFVAQPMFVFNAVKTALPSPPHCGEASPPRRTPCQ